MRILIIFAGRPLCSDLRSRRELSFDVVVPWNNRQNTYYPRFNITPKTDKRFLKRVYRFNQCSPSVKKNLLPQSFLATNTNGE